MHESTRCQYEIGAINLVYRVAEVALRFQLVRAINGLRFAVFSSMGEEEMRAFQIETIILLAALIFGFQNCSGNIKGGKVGGFTSQSLQKDISSLNDSMKNLNGDLSCTQDTDCEAVAYGSRACGGPSGYIVASTLNAHYDEILDLADKLTEKEMQYNVINNIISTCEFMMPPTPHCVSNTCQK